MGPGGYFRGGVSARISGIQACGAFGAVVVISAMLIAGGCSLLKKQAPGEAQSQPVAAKALEVSLSQVDYGRLAVCSVTGEPFVIGPASRSAIYRGQARYFKDDAAKKAFLAAPDQYIYAPPSFIGGAARSKR